MPTTNEKIIAWAVERLGLDTIASKPWTAEAVNWIEDNPPPHGNDHPPDILPMEVALRLSKYGETHSVAQDATKSG